MASSMYAIIKSGGKQYRVAKDDVIEVELLNPDVESQFEFADSDILFVSDGSNCNVGTPGVSGFIIAGEFLDEVPGPKVVSMKYKKSHRCYRKFGHRQHYSRIKITGIEKRKEKHHGS